MDSAAWAFGQSIDSDLEMWDEEIDVSIAHAEMLGKTGIIPSQKSAAIVRALGEIRKIENVSWSEFEDIHAAVEHTYRGVLRRLNDAIRPRAVRRPVERTSRAAGDAVAGALTRGKRPPVVLKWYEGEPRKPQPP